MSVYPPESNLNGWHPGEQAMQRRMGYDRAPGLKESWQYIYGGLTQQHARFHTSNLHFLPVVTLDKKGRPWSSILAAEDGDIGWIKNLRGNILELNPTVWHGDPFWENAKVFDEIKDAEEMLIAGIGVEVSTRRRNKLAGKVKRLDRKDGRKINFEVDVNEATGNCPKYIVVRSIIPHPHTNAIVVHDNQDMLATDRLPPDVISFITAADTIWLGSAYLVTPYTVDAQGHPSHLGINHRGGRPGWVRVKPSDSRTLVISDYSGNRFMSSLGNIEHTPLASIAIADFRSGDVLYLTGDAKNFLGKEAEEIMPMQKALTTLRVTGYRFVKDALPVRQVPPSTGEEVELSPYSPPVKLLREEIDGAGNVFLADAVSGEAPKAILEKIILHSASVATFTLRPSVPLHIQPGQAIILDFKSLVGSPQYRHMSELKPSLVNDDFIRTWTVSSHHSAAADSGSGRGALPENATFQLTMKEKQGGIITGALFNIARGLKENKPRLLEDVRTLHIEPRIVGVSGEFFLNLDSSAIGGDAGPSNPHSDLGMTTFAPRRLVWGAGGIGVTPFLSMLRALVSASSLTVRERPWDIVFVLSTREPEVLLPLIEDTYQGLRSGVGALTHIQLHLHVFTSKNIRDLTNLPFDVHLHHGRLGTRWFEEEKVALEGREGYVCGPPEFEELFVTSLVNDVGLRKGSVKKEGFAY